MHRVRPALLAYLEVQLIVNIFVVGLTIVGGLSGAALFGHMFALLGALSPWILFAAVGINPSLLGLANLVATLIFYPRINQGKWFTASRGVLRRALGRKAT